jgi:hypothetical protein
LSELSIESINTALELIAQGSLYRGAEKKRLLEDFRKHKMLFDGLGTNEAKQLYCWTHSESAISRRIRNDVIGTFLIDLTEGADLESAAEIFGRKMDPLNYQRPKAPITTAATIKRAKEKIEELGLTSALNRRYATLEDLSIQNVLWANPDAKGRMVEKSVFDQLIETSSKPKFDKIEEITIDKFLSDVLPRAQSLEVLVENRHSGNFVSLIAPEDITARRLFKWDNLFSWSYNGDVTDSIKERVKKAGGRVEGDLRCSLSWFNYDDLDFHMYEPNGYHIHYPNKGQWSPCCGMLDVDMNAGSGHTREAVENICYPNRAKMHEGVYKLQVHQFAQRELKDVGFEIEIEADGETHLLQYAQAVPDRSYVDVANIEFRGANSRSSPCYLQPRLQRRCGISIPRSLSRLRP